MQSLFMVNAHLMVQWSRGVHLGTSSRLLMLSWRGQWRDVVSTRDNWVLTLAEYNLCVKSSTMLVAATLALPTYTWPFSYNMTTTCTYYVTPCLLILLSCTRHTLCRRMFKV